MNTSLYPLLCREVENNKQLDIQSKNGGEEGKKKRNRKAIDTTTVFFFVCHVGREDRLVVDASAIRRRTQQTAQKNWNGTVDGDVKGEKFHGARAGYPLPSAIV